ncbi:MAG: hypothetical protein ABSE56_00080 [Bryobacteraceae bacterium]|jgi:hypothetical protein
MPSATSLLFLALTATAAARPLFFQVLGPEPGSWPEILSSVGFQPQTAGGPADVCVLRAGAAGPAEPWLARAASGAFVILEGQSPVGEAVGFRPSSRRVRVQNVQDLRRPELLVLWERAVELPVYEVPQAARVFVRERWEGAPLVAGFRHGAGGVLWVAASPGERGYERFPYLLHALADLGLTAPFRSRRLWAFFDSSYRARADLEYLAPRWRKAGIAALHVAAWHYYEPDPQRDARLRELVKVCHRNAILVYAWLELPHVSERFWDDHPEWREKTAVLQDARLDWRRLMNLANRDCFRAVSRGVRELLDRFDWDGVNLAELYFESLEGASNASRFTPMNDDVRREFQQARGFDPLLLFRAPAPGPERLRQFLDFRAELARRMQAEWLAEIETVRRQRPGLDLVLTHVDDRFDPGMRDSIGADAARLLPLLEQHDFTFLVEDPATVWHLGPQRYPEIARRYQLLARRSEKLAIDINVVERYQDVYPTKQQTGAELYQLVSLAARSFDRVALYFENSIAPVDLPLLPAAASAVNRVEAIGGRLAVESRFGVGMAWDKPALVDGAPWPVADGSTLWLPPGTHLVEKATSQAPVRLLDFNGDLKTAAARSNGLEFAYSSASRALAVLDRRPARLEIDGAPAHLELLEDGPNRFAFSLPRGQHLVTVGLSSVP